VDSLLLIYDVATGQYVLFVFKGHDSFYQRREDLKNFEILKQYKQGHGYISQKNANIGVTHSNHYALKGYRFMIREDSKYWRIENGCNIFN